MFEPIITGAFLAFGGVAALLGFLFGMRKKWQYTFLKIATTVLAAIIAIIVAWIIPATGVDALIDVIVGSLPEGIAADVESDSVDMAQGMSRPIQIALLRNS